MTEWLTTKQAAQRLYVHPDTLRKRLAAGTLTMIRCERTPGGHRRFHGGDVDRAAHGQPLPAPATPNEISIDPEIATQVLRVIDEDIWQRYGTKILRKSHTADLIMSSITVLIPSLLFMVAYAQHKNAALAAIGLVGVLAWPLSWRRIFARDRVQSTASILLVRRLLEAQVKQNDHHSKSELAQARSFLHSRHALLSALDVDAADMETVESRMAQLEAQLFGRCLPRAELLSARGQRQLITAQTAILSLGCAMSAALAALSALADERAVGLAAVGAIGALGFVLLATGNVVMYRRDIEHHMTAQGLIRVMRIHHWDHDADALDLEDTAQRWEALTERRGELLMDVRRTDQIKQASRLISQAGRLRIIV